MLLVCGNSKLGNDLIWGFSVPARETCPGATEACLKNCYALRLERTREKVLAAHQRNWEASKQPDFVKRIGRLASTFTAAAGECLPLPRYLLSWRGSRT